MRPVTRAEAEGLLTYVSDNRRLVYRWEMYVTTRLLWVTACRLDEIASLTLDRIHDRGDHIQLTIADAKTRAGNRTVMVVGESDCQLVRKAVSLAYADEPLVPENAGMLFPRLRRGGYDNKASHYFGKAFQKVRKDLKELDCGARHANWDMHSFRRTGITALVNAGVPKAERNLAVGHSNADDIGVSIYSREGDLQKVIYRTFRTLFEALGGSLDADDRMNLKRKTTPRSL